MSEKNMNEPKSICQIRVRFLDLNAENNDPFIRYWIIVYGNRKSEVGTDSEGKDVRVFLDTGANVDIMSRRQFLTFLDANFDLD